MNYIKRFLIIISLFQALAACSGSSTQEGNNVSIAVKNARRPAALESNAALPEMLQVDHFRVTVSGSGFSPIVTEYPSDSSGGNITVPVGDDRKVLVEAFNSSGVVIRRRLVEDIVIHGNQTTPVIVSLLSVPVVTNIRNNSLVRQNRVNFSGFGEPASGIQIEEITEGHDSEILTDQISATQSVSVNSNTANFSFRPGLLSLGKHTFRIRDTQTGEESIMSILVIPSNRIPGTGFSALGRVSPASFESSATIGPMPEVLDVMVR